MNSMVNYQNNGPEEEIEEMIENGNPNDQDHPTNTGIQNVSDNSENEEDAPPMQYANQASTSQYSKHKMTQLRNKQAVPQPYSRLQQSSRQNYSAYDAQRERDAQKEQKFLEVLPADRMSKFQVAFVTSVLGQSDSLMPYISDYLCDADSTDVHLDDRVAPRQHKYFRNTSRQQSKASSFLTQWMASTIPKMIYKFKVDYLLEPPEGSAINQKVPLAGGSFEKILVNLKNIMNQNMEIYNHRISDNSPTLMERLVQHGEDNFGKADKLYVKKEYLERPPYNSSIFYMVHLDVFARFGGFDLLLLTLRPARDAAVKSPHVPQFRSFIETAQLIHSVKDYLELEYFTSLVHQLRDLCLDYAKNSQVDNDSLRYVNRRDLLQFIHDIEQLLYQVVFETNQAIREDNRRRKYLQTQQENEAEQVEPEQKLTEMSFETDVYQYTEQMELAFALQCIKMPILEKKFIGHDFIRQKIEQVKNKQDPKGHVSTIYQLRQQSQRWITKQYLLEWIDKSKIFEMMFGQSLHPEVIKKSNFLLEFLYQNGRIGEAQINMIWDCAMQKHEVYKVAILKAIMFIASIAKYKELRIIYQKIVQTPLGQTDKFLMQLLKTIARNISRVLEVEPGNMVNVPNRKSRRHELLMNSQGGLRSFGRGSRGRGTSSGQPWQHRRSSDVGVNKSGKAQMVSGLDLAKIAAWDDHDVPTKNAQTSENIRIIDNYFKRPDAKYKDQKMQRRSSSSNKQDLKGRDKNSLLLDDEPKKDVIPKKNNEDLGLIIEQPILQPIGQKIERFGRIEQSSGEEQSDIVSGDITNVPLEKEDKKTADEDDSPKNQIGHRTNDLFEDHESDPPSPYIKDVDDYEEEKVAAQHDIHQVCDDGTQGENKDMVKVTLKKYLFDIQIHPKRKDGEQELSDMKRLAIEVLKLLWSYCQEDLVNQPANQIDQIQQINPDSSRQGGAANQGSGNLSAQVHQVAIEHLCQVLNQQFPMSSFFFMNKCVQNIKQNKSVISSQVILKKLIEGTQYPILLTDYKKEVNQENQINSRSMVETERLPKNMCELIEALDKDLKITNECLASYVEFKRASVQQIFDQFGNMENDLLGPIGADQDGDLETQSSLDNNTNQTGENRSRFSQSIVSSTQKSDTADYLTNMSKSQPKSSTQQQIKQKPQINTNNQQHEIQKLHKTSSNDTWNEFNTSSSFKQKSKEIQESGGMSALLKQSNDLVTPGQTAETLQGKAMTKGNSTQVTAKNNDDLVVDSQNNQLNIEQNDELISPKENKVLKTKAENKKDLINEVDSAPSESKNPPALIDFSPDKESNPIQEAELGHRNSAGNNTQSAQNRHFLRNLITNTTLQLNYLEEINRRLDFLKFLTRTSSCKTLKQSQINILWECLVVNAFNEDERDQFFVFCTEVLNAKQMSDYREAQARYQNGAADLAGDLLFEDDCFEMIFFEILLRLDYKTSEAGNSGFTTKMYQCFERYFIYVNEQYGQIMTSTHSMSTLSSQTCDITSSPIQFDVHDYQLVGIEALWEIILSVQDEAIYKRASKFLLRLYKKLTNDGQEKDESSQKTDLQSVKELIFSTCMAQIKQGLSDILSQNQQQVRSSQYEFIPGSSADPASTYFDHIQQIESGELNGANNLGIEPLHPDLINSASIDESKIRIARSIKLMSQFIDEFEGIRSNRKNTKAGSSADKEVQIQVQNQNNASGGPKKFNMTLGQSTKLMELKDQIGQKLNKPRPGRELCLLWKGKYLNEDLQTLKDLKMNSMRTDGSIEPVKLILSLKNDFELQADAYATQGEQYPDQELSAKVLELKEFLAGEMACSDDVTKLALKKCKLDLNAVMMMLLDPDSINDLEEELRQEQEHQSDLQLMTKNNQNDEEEKEEFTIVEQKLNEMISNRSECFDLLFDLLNLGLPDVTQASWSLLTQVPVNQQLLTKIRQLDLNSAGEHKQMSQMEWSRIIDPNSIHKMLYSLQLVNQLITINNEKLSEGEIQERFEWRKRFLEKGGFDHLYMILITYDFDAIISSDQDSQIALLTSPAPTASSKHPRQKGESPDRNFAKHNSVNQNLLFQTTQAECLGHLISIIKIFLQAAILSNDEKGLLHLIASSSTSPFKKQPNPAAGPSPSYGQENSSSGKGVNETHSDKEGNSSVHTAKFANSFSSNNAVGLGESQDGPGSASFGAEDKLDKKKSIQTQVDDFPKLIEQMRQNGIAENVLTNVVNFGSFIRKLLEIIWTAICVFKDLDHQGQVQSAQQGHLNSNQQQKGDQEAVPQLVQNCLDLLLPCILWDPKTQLQQIFKFKKFEDILIQGLLRSKSEKIRKSLESNFKTLCYQIMDKRGAESEAKNEQDPENDDEAKDVRVFIIKLLVQNLPQSVVKGKFRNMEYEFFDEYFSLMCQLIKISKEYFQEEREEDLSQNKSQQVAQTPRRDFYLEQLNKFQSSDILIFCINTIKTNHYILSGLLFPSNKKLSQSKQSSAERLLQGYLYLCQSILEVIPGLKARAQEECNLVATITEFILNTDQSHEQTQKQVNRQTRKRAFALLLTLCERNSLNFAHTMKLLYKFHGQIDKSWRYIDYSEFDADLGVKQASGYVGLRNFGCTCYMNSMLQQLFMSTDLRRHVLEIQFDKHQYADTNESVEDNVLYQLQSIFANLQESEKSYFVPSGFVKSFKFYGDPVNVGVQMDVQEFYNVLRDHIENLLPKPKKNKDDEESKEEKKEDNFLMKTLGGKVVNEVKSLEKEYPYVGETEEEFFAIYLDIKNKKTLEEALDLYVKPDILEGENKYDCEAHGRKVSAQRRTYLKDLSNTVAISLKRLEFDYSTMQRYKVNDYCAFPERINFRKWAQEGIHEAEQKHDQGEEKKQTDLRESDEDSNQDSHLDDNDDIVDDPPQEDPTVHKQDKFEENVLREEGGAQMDQGIDVDDDQINEFNPDKEVDKAKDDTFQIADASGGSRKSVQRRVRSSSRNRPKTMTHPKPQEPLNLSIDNKQIDEDVENSDKNPKKQKPRSHKQGFDKSEERNRASKKLVKEDQQRDPELDKYEYQLVGVLIHSGSADAGHYYSYIKERNPDSPNYGRWFEFNDTQVRDYDFSNLARDCFGGQRQNRDDGPAEFYENDGNTGGYQTRMFERCCNAYYLFYERVYKIEEKQEDKVEKEDDMRLQELHKERIFDKIHQQNQAFKHLKIFTDNDFINFMLDYINLCQFQEVLYFSKRHSLSHKMRYMEELTGAYIEDHNAQAKRLQREQEIAQLRNKAVSPTRFTLARDYKQSLLEIQMSRIDSDIFDKNVPENDMERMNVRNVDNHVVFEPKEAVGDRVPDVGFKSIQLAVILAQDIILKLKDTQAFVRLIQRATQMMQSHALASVWFIKWISEQKCVLQEVLLGSPYAEVREVFANLLSTAFGAAIKSEENYLEDVVKLYDFSCEQVLIENFEPPSFALNLSACIRLLRILMSDMMNCARVNWRNFNEFFTLLREFAQSNFLVNKFMLREGLIRTILEFVMNNKPPFYNSQGGSHYRMGDSVQQPNFQGAYELFAYLVRSCLTKGIVKVQWYAPTSMFQEKNKMIDLPEDHLNVFLTSACQNEILNSVHYYSDTQNKAIEETMIHLSWGDVQNSCFFLRRLIIFIKQKRAYINGIGMKFHFRMVEELIWLQDHPSELHAEYKKRRIDDVLLNFDSVQNHGPSSASGFMDRVPYLFLSLQKNRIQHPIFVLKMLNLVGKLALRDPQEDKYLLGVMRRFRGQIVMWIWQFVNQIRGDQRLAHRANVQLNIDLVQLQQHTMQQYKHILEIDTSEYSKLLNPQQAFEEEARNINQLKQQMQEQNEYQQQAQGAVDLTRLAEEGEERKESSPTQSAAPSSRPQPEETKPVADEEENIFNLVSKQESAESKAQNHSFSSIQELQPESQAPQGSKKVKEEQKIDFYGAQPQKTNMFSFVDNEYGVEMMGTNEDQAAQIVDETAQASRAPAHDPHAQQMEDEIREQTQFGADIGEDQEDLETLQTTLGLLGTDADGRPAASFNPFGGDETGGDPLSAMTPEAQATSDPPNPIDVLGNQYSFFKQDSNQDSAQLPHLALKQLDPQEDELEAVNEDLHRLLGDDDLNFDNLDDPDFLEKQKQEMLKYEQMQQEQRNPNNGMGQMD